MSRMRRCPRVLVASLAVLLVHAAPLAGVDRSEYLLVLSRSAALPPRPEPADEDPAARKAGKGRGKR